jgi:hypothetical protein
MGVRSTVHLWYICQLISRRGINRWVKTGTCGPSMMATTTTHLRISAL